MSIRLAIHFLQLTGPHKHCHRFSLQKSGSTVSRDNDGPVQECAASECQGRSGGIEQPYSFPSTTRAGPRQPASRTAVKGDQTKDADHVYGRVPNSAWPAALPAVLDETSGIVHFARG
jgi:hypothetical protein